MPSVRPPVVRFGYGVKAAAEAQPSDDMHNPHVKVADPTHVQRLPW
jgi:hypothetical protein